jgi:hypothetical protein
MLFTISTAMRKVTLVATATALVIAAAFAQESKMTLGEGEAVLIGPGGTMHKSNTTISDAHHRAALAKGANEISRGTVFYRYGGKLYVSCVGPYIGGWKQGYPNTENTC